MYLCRVFDRLFSANNIIPNVAVVISRYLFVKTAHLLLGTWSVPRVLTGRARDTTSDTPTSVRAIIAELPPTVLPPQPAVWSVSRRTSSVTHRSTADTKSPTVYIERVSSLFTSWCQCHFCTLLTAALSRCSHFSFVSVARYAVAR